MHRQHRQHGQLSKIQAPLQLNHSGNLASRLETIMRKKDYELIAQSLNEVYEFADRDPKTGVYTKLGTGEVIGILQLQEALIERFEQVDPRFDDYKFRKACKLEARFQS